MKKRIISKRIIAALLAASFMLTGCGKEEDSREEIKDPVINSMSVEEICDYLSNAIDVDGHQYYSCDAGNSGDIHMYVDDGIIDRGRIVVYDTEDPTDSDSPKKYYINFVVSELDSDAIAELDVGDYSGGGTVVAVSGNFSLIGYEVTDYELFRVHEEDVRNNPLSTDFINIEAPYSAPELQAVYELFVELGEVTSLDDIDIEAIVPEPTAATVTTAATETEETVPVPTTDESLVINSMTVEQIFEILSPQLDPAGNHQYGGQSELVDASELDDTVLELGYFMVFDREDGYDENGSYAPRTEYYMMCQIARLTPEALATVQVGEYYVSDDTVIYVSAIAGDFIFEGYEVLDFELFDDSYAHPLNESGNYDAPYADPNLQTAYETFVALSEAASLDELPAGGPSTDVSAVVPDNDEYDDYVSWYDEGYVSSPYTYTNTTYIRLDYLNDFYLSYEWRTIFYDVVYNGQTVYTSGDGYSEAIFDVNSSGAVTDGQYLAAGTYTIHFYDDDVSDVCVGESTCTVVVE